MCLCIPLVLTPTLRAARECPYFFINVCPVTVHLDCGLGGESVGDELKRI